MTDEQFILVAGLLLAAGLAASLMASRLRVPGLLLFLGLGMAVGSDGTGWLPFDDYELAGLIGVVALALILFEGGLTAGYSEVRPVLAPALGLALVGTLVTAVITGLVASALFGFSTLEGLLLGSIVASTDGAAIFGLLRGSTLRRRVARTLEGEAGLNDPVAVLLVLGFIEWLKAPDYGLVDMAGLFARQLGIGAAVGVAVGAAAVYGFQRARLETPGLYPVASLAVAAIGFGGGEVLDGSGFLAVYLVGLALGGSSIPAKRTVSTFHQGLAWVAQLTMFLTLGLLVFPAELPGVALEGTLLALVLGLVARPVAAVVGTLGAGFSAAERAVLGWAGLRGAVPVVLATFPVIADVPRSDEFFDIVFFAVLLSTLIQGSSFEAVARRLGVTTSEPALPSPIAEAGTIRRLGAEVLEYPVGGDDAIVGLRIRDLGLPRDALVNVIVRDGQALPPRGSSRIEAGDVLHVLVRQEASAAARALLDRWRSGPVGPPPLPRRRRVGAPSVFQVRTWKEEDGDPGRPARVAGRVVADQLRTRRDVPGALVVLDDGYFAVTGPQLALGARGTLSAWTRRRLRSAKTDAERAWWEEVLGALAL